LYTGPPEASRIQIDFLAVKVHCPRNAIIGLADGQAHRRKGRYTIGQADRKGDIEVVWIRLNGNFL